ncbi:MAG: sodium:calcium exchanger, partial [Oscillochloris sp.]|nr:sodium:calcium exchanger [Oscillochloris sp.]
APGAISVTYATSNGTAINGTDYTGSTNTLNFAAGNIEKTISIPIINDGSIETLDEIFNVTLSAPVNATLGRASATVAIIDNDKPLPLAQAGFLQTGGLNYNTNSWNYYANVDAGYTYLRIDVPCVATASNVQIDLYDAGMNTLSTEDEIVGAADTTTFSLFKQGPGWTYADGLPALAAVPDYVGSYSPNTTSGLWTTLTTLPASDCGVILLRVETQDNDMNGWGIRVGWQVATTDPPTQPTSDTDGTAGSGDEITFGLQQTTLRHALGANQCTTFYEYVQPGLASVTFHNYDMDSLTMLARVRYYSPSASYDPLANTGGLVGTASDDGIWNNSLNNIRVGDTITSPESGWWRIVTCTSDLGNQNQFIQEGQIDQPAYLVQPGTPALDITMTPSAATVAPGGNVSFDLAYTNTSSGFTAGAAMDTTFTITLPNDLAFVGCVGGTCIQSGSTLTITVGKVISGASATVTVNTQASSTGSGLVGLSLKANYSDVLGNPFIGSAGATATIVP